MGHAVRRAAAVFLAMMSWQVAAAARVEGFSPEGEAKGVRQATVRFGEPMVAFGDPRLADPLTWKCEGDPRATRARGRWIDANQWALDFEADLPAGVSCRFALKPGLKTVAGAALTGPQAFTFNDGRPRGRRLGPHRRRRIDRRGSDLPARLRRGAWTPQACPMRGARRRA